MDIEKVAQDRYRLRSHDHIMTVSAQDLLDVMDWVLLRATELRKEAEQAEPPSHDDIHTVEAYRREAEARIADAIARNQAMELAPNEIEAEQEDEDTRKYMEHHYLGGE